MVHKQKIELTKIATFSIFGGNITQVSIIFSHCQIGRWHMWLYAWGYCTVLNLDAVDWTNSYSESLHYGTYCQVNHTVTQCAAQDHGIL